MLETRLQAAAQSKAGPLYSDERTSSWKPSINVQQLSVNKHHFGILAEAERERVPSTGPVSQASQHSHLTWGRGDQASELCHIWARDMQAASSRVSHPKAGLPPDLTIFPCGRHTGNALWWVAPKTSVAAAIPCPLAPLWPPLHPKSGQPGRLPFHVTP